jgi:ATP-dependent Lon protease
MSESDISVSNANELPLLPLRDVVVYPHMVTPLFVGRGRSIEALERAMVSDKQVLLVAQRTVLSKYWLRVSSVPTLKLSMILIPFSALVLSR